MAPSTPPPPRSDEFAALTIASTACFVMSPCSNSIRTPSPDGRSAAGVDLAGRGGEPRHVLVQPPAGRRADHAQAPHHHPRLGREALEGGVDAEPAELLLVPPD